MKKNIPVLLLFLGAFTLAAQITVIHPNGGERLPRNGQMFLWWSNSVPLQVAQFLDRYDENGVFVQACSVGGQGYFIAGLDYAGKDPSIFPIGQYKLRVIGQSPDGQVFTDESDGFFYITRDASMSCSAVDYNDWVLGHTKAFTISWNGLAVGDTYKLYFPLWDEYLGEGYGFILKSGIIESEVGSITFNAPFPTEAMSMYSLVPSVPIDANYYAMFIDENNYLRAESYPISVITKEVRVRVFEQKDFSTELLKPMVPLSLVVDARYAHDSVQSLTVPITVWLGANNAEYLCVLFDREKPVSEFHLVKTKAGDKYVCVKFTTHGFIVRKGNKASLELRCVPISGVGQCVFGLDREETLTVVGTRREEISSAMRGMWGPTVTVTNRQPPHRH
ncbi:MAG: hypothetical protein NT155_04245 [Candidatus Staskawiczbacteria bacterium]|nr:hypothetical protein [Candidatus Staskawiczbacteria bacterium]